jgi:hypothetical protein
VAVACACGYDDAAPGHQAVRSRFFYLERFRRGQTGAVTLRWRQTTGRWRHLAHAAPTVRQLPPTCARGTPGRSSTRRG